MSFRPATSILAKSRGAFALKTTPRVVKSVRFSTALPRYKESVASGYGDDGSPASAHPKEQGAESQAHRNLEHPGPAPVSEGKNEDVGRSYKEKDASFNSSANASANDTRATPNSSGTTDNTGNAQPKINRGDSFGKESEDVKQHNANMGKREVDDDPKQEVPKSFWTGTTGNQ